MRITQVSAANWRNFKRLTFTVPERLFIVGPNAAGKSNLLDLFRFLGDIAAPGGGIAAAVTHRGGYKPIRSLFARTHEKGRIVIDVTLEDDDDVWRYRLALKGEQGRNLTLVNEEIVEFNGSTVVRRPDAQDEEDPERLTQTHLEQISANRSFRPIAEHFSKIRYFHLVPQVIRDPSRSGATGGDPYGGDFIAKMNSIPPQTRRAWMRRLESALQSAVPEFESLAIETDSTGRPHLTAGYRNWRAPASKQYETEFSDGTLRLIGLLWTIVSTPTTGGMLLLEEPELSLNTAVVRTLPHLLGVAQRDRRLQIMLSTHAPAILDEESVHQDEVLVLRVTTDGTDASTLSTIEEAQAEIDAGLPLSDVVDGLMSPTNLTGLTSAAKARRRS